MGQFVYRSLETKYHKNIVVGSIYRPPRNLVDQISAFVNDMNDLANKLQGYKHVLLAGDFNLDLM